MKALEEGAYIKHFQYGLGVVTESNSDRTSIDFDLHGMKKFVTSIMVVDAAEGTPPKRRRAKKIKKVVAAVLASRAGRRRQVSHEIIVQFLGYEVKALVREYTFTVREASTEPREFTLTIPTEAFNERLLTHSRCARRLFAQTPPRAGHVREPSAGHSLRHHQRGARGLPQRPRASNAAIPV